MARRSSLTVALPVVAVCALLLTACGEQVPGGLPAEGQQTQDARVDEKATDSEGAGGSEAAEQTESPATAEPTAGSDVEEQIAGSDPDDPIVVQIGDDEFETNMAIYRRYDRAKGGALALREPVAPAEPVDDGMRQEYRAGAIYWSPDTGAHIIRGQILAAYRDNDGPAGQLGWPVGDETVEGEAIYSDFEHGQIRFENESIEVLEHPG